MKRFKITDINDVEQLMSDGYTHVIAVIDKTRDTYGFVISRHRTYESALLHIHKSALINIWSEENFVDLKDQYELLKLEDKI